MPPRAATATRQRILDAAQAAVLERGFSATSVDTIQAAAGISRGTFFYHFPTKDHLARSLIERYADVDRKMVDGFMARAEQLARDPLEQALIFVTLHEDLFQEDTGALPGCLFASYSYEAGLFDEGTHGLIEDSIRHFRDVFGGKLREAMERHETVVETDPVELADFGYGIMQGAFILSRQFDDTTLMIAQIRRLRTHLELLFGVAQQDG